MTTGALRLRWSWRDLRQHWVQVTAIALMLGVGVGVFAAFGSTAAWRGQSNDRSFAVTGFHDLKVRLASGTTAPAGTLRAAVGQMAHADDVQAGEERLVWPTLVAVGAADARTFVSGELVGSEPGAAIDTTAVREGRTPRAGEDAALLEYTFASDRDLPVAGDVEVAGGSSVPYVGLAMSPEYFYVLPAGGEVFARGNHAALFLTLGQAQALAQQPGQVNDLVVRLVPGADVVLVTADLEAAMNAAGLSAAVTTGAEEPAYRLLYEDIEGDQQIWNVVSALILLGASFAAFNLISRLVEAQRREIGIGMALGVPPSQLAMRPLLVGAQVAGLGVVFGIVVGLGVGQLMRGLLDQALPLPIWVTPFQPGLFVLAGAIGLVVPMVATAWPVWRAVRVAPITAIRTGRFATGSSGWARLATRLRWPHSSTAQMPVRNLLRRPRRTVLTALAIAAAMTVLVAVFGMLDSFGRTIDLGISEITRRAGDRVNVQLSTFEASDGPTMTAVRAHPVVGSATTELILPIELRRVGHEPIDAAGEVIDNATAPWTPTVRRGEPASLTAGIVIAAKAAADLGVGPGSTVTLRHPQREGLGYQTVDTEVRVAGIHNLPLRSFVYLDSSQASLFGLDGVTNRLQVLPATGYDASAVQQALFALPGVASAQAVNELGRSFHDAVRQFTTILLVAQGAVLLLALLIAFNASSISVDERGREHATMFAFGLPRRTVVVAAMVESAAIGLIGTALGTVSGFLVVRWIFESLVTNTLPDIGFDAYVSPGTLVTVMLLGVAAVALAPALTIRRLRRMDVPTMLRVVE